MGVVGGFDSSNTAHLLEIPHMRQVPSFHINTAECIKATNTITHRTVDGVVIEDEFPFLTSAMLWEEEEQESSSSTTTTMKKKKKIRNEGRKQNGHPPNPNEYQNK